MQMKQRYQEGATPKEKVAISFGVLLIGIQDISTQHYTAQILKI